MPRPSEPGPAYYLAARVRDAKVVDLPGLAMPADWPRYPSRNPVVDYLEQYRATLGIEPHYGSRVSPSSTSTVGGSWRRRSVNGVPAT